MKNKTILFLILIFFASTFSQAHELKCEISPFMYNYPEKEYVTTKSFKLNITFTNIGDKTFPSTKVSVAIYNPKGELPRDYYSFQFTLPDLTHNDSDKTFDYSRPWLDKPGRTIVYPLGMPGTWWIEVILIDSPPDEKTFVNHEDVVTVDKCFKYFSVEEFSIHERERNISQRNSEIQEKISSLTNKLKDLTISLSNLTVVLVVIAILTLLSNFFPNFSKWISTHKLSILLIEGILTGAFYVLLYSKSILLNVIMGAALLWYLVVIYKKKVQSLIIPIVNFFLLLLNGYLAYYFWGELNKIVFEFPINEPDSIAFFVICLISAVTLFIITLKSLSE